MFRRHVALGERYRDRGDLEVALTEIERALRFKPLDENAVRMRAEILRLLGRRSGEIETIMTDTYAEMQARQQQRVVTVRRKLAEAERYLEAGNVPEARRSLTAAHFMAETARKKPYYTEEMDELRRKAEERVQQLPSRK